MTIAQRDGVPLVATLAWRYGLGTLLLVAAHGRAVPALARGDAAGAVLRLGTMQALVAVVSLSALAFIPAATLSFLFYTYPAIIAILAAVRCTEPLTPVRIAALVLALAGIGTMVGLPEAGATHPAGVALALLSALLYALYVPMAGRYERTIGPLPTATYAAMGAAILFAAAGVALPGLTAGLRTPATASGWMAVAFLAIFSTALAFMGFLRGLAVLGAVRTAIVSTVEPFVTAVLGALVLGQPLSRATFLGGVLVAAGVVVLQTGGRRVVPAANPMELNDG